MNKPNQHVAYLGTVLVRDTLYIGHLREHPEIGPDAYSMHVRSVDSEGNQMEAAMRGRFEQFDTAVTWALLHMLEYMLSIGIDIGEIGTVHRASAGGIDLDQVCLAIIAETQRMREEAAASPKH
ncbi:hypothetical protein J7E49_21515 [Variovorax paradoxus]|nr:hypothetical protein [Variovorax paradoxus]